MGDPGGTRRPDDRCVRAEDHRRPGPLGHAQLAHRAGGGLRRDIRGASAADAPGSGLSRTITVAPLYVEDGAVALAIDAQETLADERATPPAGAPCTFALPRRIVASHPGLNARAAQWTDWTLAERNPQLVYRVRARVVED